MLTDFLYRQYFQGKLWREHCQVLRGLCDWSIWVPSQKRNHLQGPEAWEPHVRLWWICKTGRLLIYLFIVGFFELIPDWLALRTLRGSLWSNFSVRLTLVLQKRSSVARRHGRFVGLLNTSHLRSFWIKAMAWVWTFGLWESLSLNFWLEGLYLPNIPLTPLLMTENEVICFEEPQNKFRSD